MLNHNLCKYPNCRKQTMMQHDEFVFTWFKNKFASLTEAPTQILNSLTHLRIA